MKSRIFVPLLLVCALLSPLRAQPTPVQQHGQLRVQGNRIVNQAGQPVALRGMALYWSQWQGQFYNAGAVQWLKDDWRCAIVRASMAVTSGGYITNPTAERNKVIAVVDAAIQLGIYVIIDWHEHNAQSYTAQAQAFFEDMATRYGQYPNVLYELWNEPLDTHAWASVIKPYHEAVIPRIRARDPDNIILLGSRSWDQEVDEAAANPVTVSSNLAYTLHFYAGTHRQTYRDKGNTALSRGVALFISEWGTSEATGNGNFDTTETRLWWNWANQNSIGWCNWSIAAINETSAALRPGANATGGWTTANLSPSGIFLRNNLRLMNVPTPIQTGKRGFVKNRPRLKILGNTGAILIQNVDVRGRYQNLLETPIIPL